MCKIPHFCNVQDSLSIKPATSCNLNIMRLQIKFALLQKQVRQYRMAAALGMDPTKLSRIINGVVEPSAGERLAIATFLNRAENDLFESRPAHQLQGAQQ